MCESGLDGLLGELTVVVCFSFGRREQLAGKIQERYGLAKDEVERQLAEWQRSASDAWFKPGKHDR